MATSGISKPLALVTGASSGIGYELAKVFARNGYDLVVAAEGAGIEGAARDFELLGARCLPVRTDLSTKEGVERLYAEAKELAVPIEAVAINAGVGVGGDFARATDLEQEIALVNLNVVSTVRLAKLVVKDMVARGRGRVLITASIAGIMPTPLEAVYGASKAFTLSFAASLHDELSGTGVTVTALMPGPTNTNFFHRAGLDDTKVGAIEKNKNQPADVAKQGFDALMAGKDRVVAGSLATRLQGAAARFIPERLKGRQHRKMAEPGSAAKH